MRNTQYKSRADLAKVIADIRIEVTNTAPKVKTTANSQSKAWVR
jgi:hypothetical protein